jgi:ATP-dependent exoDNAse (exonuclease V) alpha subunit
MIFRGGAGTGKSFTLREVKRGLDAVGYNVVVLAPQRKQVMALQEDGFAGAETVASFLHRSRLATGSVVIVDEAGLLGVRDMREIMLLVRTIPATFRQFTYGYAVTSHASQGLTVDHVLLALDSQSGPAVNAKQFYVSTSRGREGLRIYTDDVEALREQIARSGHRPLALKVVEAARRLRIRPEVAAQIVGKVSTVVDALCRLNAWRAQCAAQMGPRNSNHVDLWQ